MAKANKALDSLITLRSVNPFFEYWLSKWREETSTKGSNAQFTYHKAINSLRKYPVPLRSGVECNILAFFGKSLCDQLDKKLEAYRKDTGDRTEFLDNEEVMKYLQSFDRHVRWLPSADKVLKQRVVRNPKIIAAHANAAAKAGNVDAHKRDRIDKQSASAVEPAQVKRRRTTSVEDYVPQYRSGAYALLIALHEQYTDENASRRWLSKAELTERAQSHSDASFTKAERNDYYTAWSSMGKLLKKQLVDKQSHPPRFVLTESGIALAARLRSASSTMTDRTAGSENSESARSDDSDSDAANLTVTRREAATSNSRLRPTVGDSRSDHHSFSDSDSNFCVNANANENENENANLEGKQDGNDSDSYQPYDPYENGYDLDYGEDYGFEGSNTARGPAYDDDCDQVAVARLSSAAGSEVQSNAYSNYGSFHTQIGFAFTYVDADGRDTMRKDAAACRVFEQISMYDNVAYCSNERAGSGGELLGVAFLVRCNRADIVRCSFRYKIDGSCDSREVVLAYVGDVNTPEIATGFRSEAASKEKKARAETRPNNGDESDESEVLVIDDSDDDLPPPISLLLSDNRTDRTGKDSASVSNTTKTKSSFTKLRDVMAMDDDDCLPDVGLHAKPVNAFTEPSHDTVPKRDRVQAAKSERPNAGKSRKGAAIPEASISEKSIIPSRVVANQVAKAPADTAVSSEYGCDSGSVVLPGHAFTLASGSYEIVLCVDQREQFGAGASRQQLQTELVRQSQDSGVRFELRKLEIGDFLWIARSKQAAAEDGSEVVLELLVERKRVDDLAGSVLDGRFNEQKFRMKHSGLRPVYLVEAYQPGSATLSHARLPLPIESLRQAISNTRAIDSFSVVETRDLADTVRYLMNVTKMLQRLYRSVDIRAIDESSSSRNAAAFSVKELDAASGAHVRYRRAFGEFQRNAVKNRPLTISSMLARWLYAIRGMSAAKARAIAQHFGTPARLYGEYRALPDARCRSLHLAKLQYTTGENESDDEDAATAAAATAGGSEECQTDRDRKRKRNIGPAISKAVLKCFFDEALEEKKKCK